MILIFLFLFLPAQREPEVFGLLAFLLSFFPLTRRLQNMDIPRVYALLALIPPLSIWLNLLCAFCPPMENRISGRPTSKRRAIKEASKTLRIARGGEVIMNGDLSEIKLAVSSDRLVPTDLIWNESQADWVPLAQHPLLVPMFESPTEAEEPNLCVEPEVQESDDVKGGYTVGKDGEELGKFSADDIRFMLQKGDLLPDDYFWSEIGQDWKPLSENKLFSR